MIDRTEEEQASHAAKDRDGHLLAPVIHAEDCPVPLAHAALAKAGLEEAHDGHL